MSLRCMPAGSAVAARKAAQWQCHTRCGAPACSAEREGRQDTLLHPVLTLADAAAACRVTDARIQAAEGSDGAQVNRKDCCWCTT